MAAQVSLEAEVTALRRELQKQEQRAMVGRLEVRKARTELQALHKEHERASKTVEWLQTEKKALDARAETDKVGVRRVGIASPWPGLQAMQCRTAVHIIEASTTCVFEKHVCPSAGHDQEAGVPARGGRLHGRSGSGEAQDL